jgi:pimeloyl-ACP methyl ester carboxylesterase
MINELAVYESGDPAGEPVLFIHGAAGASWSWRDVTPRLPEFYCIAADMPEHGKSMRNAAFTIDSTTEQMLDLSNTLSPTRKVHVVGLSVGAQVALEMLSRAPERIASAIASGVQALELPGYRMGMYSETVWALIYALGISPWKNNDAWIHWNMRALSGIPETLFDEYRQNFQSLTRDSWSKPMAENYRFRLPPHLNTVDVPVLLVAGDKETTDVLPTVKALLPMVPGARAALAGNGRGWSTEQQHNWPMNDPALFAQMVREWVTRREITDGLKPLRVEDI